MASLEFDAGVLTALKIILEEGMDINLIEEYMNHKTEEFKERYGIPAYDELEGSIEKDD